MRRYRVSCQRCELELNFVERIGEDELRVLRQHLVAAHQGDAVVDDAPAGQVLRHFAVAEVTR